MIKSNTTSIRSRYQEILYCFQCLYQNGAITIEEKNELITALKDCLSSDNALCDKRTMSDLLQNILYKDGLEMFLKQMVEKSLQAISLV